MTTAIPPLPPGHPDEFLGAGMPPSEQIRIMLARKKTEGITLEWDTLWRWCIARCRQVHDRDERHADGRVIAWSEPFFKAAYYDQESPPGVTRLLELLSLIEQEHQ